MAGLLSLGDLSYAVQAGLTVEEAIRLALVRNERAQIAERRVTAASPRSGAGLLLSRPHRFGQ